MLMEHQFGYKPQTILLLCPAETQLERLRKRAKLSGRADDESEDKRAQRVNDFEVQNRPVVDYLRPNGLLEVSQESDDSEDVVYERFEMIVQEAIRQQRSEK
jgi:hypothetical protein